MKRVLKKIKKGKSVGPDDIPAEVWKVLGGVGLDCTDGGTKKCHGDGVDAR